MTLRPLDVERTGEASRPGNPAMLLSALERVGAEERAFTEAFYGIFFERRPDTLPLFGAHSISEREEMIRETLHSMFALLEGEQWLEGNSIALGESHAEYGVMPEMYDAYCDAFIDTARQVLGDTLSDSEAEALRDAVGEIARRMSEAGASEGMAPSRGTLTTSIRSG